MVTDKIYKESVSYLASVAKDNNNFIMCEKRAMNNMMKLGVLKKGYHSITDGSSFRA